MVSIKTENHFEKTIAYLNNSIEKISPEHFTKYGERGVALLSEATPKKTGKTASSWTYEIMKTSNGCKIAFKNSNINNGEAIALLIQYGHGLDNGGFVEGIDYINPVLKELALEIENDLRKEFVK